MNVVRITRCKELIAYWPFFVQGIEFTARYLRYPYTFDVYRRILQHLVTTPSSWVAVVLDDNGQPVCFGAAYDCTPYTATEREYDIPFLYHQPSQIVATSLLRKEFEKFARRLGVKRYFLTTTRSNRMAQKCIARFGFRLSHVVYQREITNRAS